MWSIRMWSFIYLRIKKRLHRRLLPEIAAFSVSVLGDRKGHSFTIEYIYQMSKKAARSLTPPGRDMQRVLVSV